MSDETAATPDTSMDLGIPSLCPHIGNGTATFINRGAAADIWLIETPELKCISKTLRLTPDCFPIPRGRVQDGESSTQPNDLAHQFIKDFGFKAAQWATLRHQNLVRVLGLGERLDLRVEYCENGIARQYLEKYNGDQQKKKSMVESILEGIDYLHSQDPPIVHGSLKAFSYVLQPQDSVFVAADGTAKIGEFGLSSMTRSFALLAPSISQAGLSRWMSPELVDIDPDVGTFVPTTASDIWALGCTFMEILSGEIPYKRYKHELRVRRAIIAGEKPWPTISGAGEEFHAIWPVLMWCWETSPGARPSASTIRAFRLLDIPISRSGITGRHSQVDPGSITALLQSPSRAVGSYSLPFRPERPLPITPPLFVRSGPPSPSQTPPKGQIFLDANIRDSGGTHTGCNPVTSQLTQSATTEYRAFGLEKEPHSHKATEVQEEHERGFPRSRWILPSDSSEEDIPPAAQRRVDKPPRPRPKDLDAPKKPLSAQLLFLQWVRADQIRANEVFGDETDTTRQSVLAAVRWGTLSDPEKKPFLEQAEREMTSYEAARKDYGERASAQKTRRWRRTSLGSKLHGTGFRGSASPKKEYVARSTSPGLPSSPFRGDPRRTSVFLETPSDPEEWPHPWDATSSQPTNHGFEPSASS